MNIWEIKLDNGDSRPHISAFTEMEILDCENDYQKWIKIRKRFFRTREDAENYARPIIEKAYEYLLSDLEANREDGEPNHAKNYREKGLVELRQESISENDPCKHLQLDFPRTIWICPQEHSSDSHSVFFGAVEQATLY